MRCAAVQRTAASPASSSWKRGPARHTRCSAGQTLRATIPALSKGNTLSARPPVPPAGLPGAPPATKSSYVGEAVSKYSSTTLQYQPLPSKGQHRDHRSTPRTGNCRLCRSAPGNNARQRFSQEADFSLGIICLLFEQRPSPWACCTVQESIARGWR